MKRVPTVLLAVVAGFGASALGPATERASAYHIFCWAEASPPRFFRVDGRWMAASTHRITCLAGVQSIRVVGTLTEGGVVRDLKAKACYTTSTCFVVTRARARPNNGKLWHGFTSGGVQEPGDTYRRPIRRARSRCTTLFIL